MLQFKYKFEKLWTRHSSQSRSCGLFGQATLPLHTWFRVHSFAQASWNQDANISSNLLSSLSIACICHCSNGNVHPMTFAFPQPPLNSHLCLLNSLDPEFSIRVSETCRWRGNSCQADSTQPPILDHVCSNALVDLSSFGSGLTTSLSCSLTTSLSFGSGLTPRLSCSLHSRFIPSCSRRLT